MRSWMVLAVLLGACGSDPSGPAPRDADLKVLFIGNSLTSWNDLPFIVEAMGDSAGLEPMLAARVVAPNTSLEDHWLSGVAPGAIRGDDWDVVVVQQGPSSEAAEHLLEWVARFKTLTDSIGARLAVYMVWPEEARKHAFGAVSFSYRNAAEVTGSALYPVGDAWQEAWELNPNLPLYGPDRFHPSVVGSYLAALTIFQGIYGEEPDEVPARLKLRSGVTVEVPPTIAEVLKTGSKTAFAAGGIR